MLTRRSKISQSSVPPAKPTVFHGREREVERLVIKAIAPCSAPLGIIGPGGIGKTALALNVLHDTRVRQYFSKQRLFVSCEDASSTSDVLGQLALKLGIRPSQDIPLWPAVLDKLRLRQRTLLILDNFETIWSPTDQALRDDAEIFLAQLVVLDELTLLVTTRGNYLPSDFTWANVDTAELDTLSSTAARHTFEDLSYIEPDILGSEPESEALTKLLREVDFVPLAITLLARLDDLPSRLLREWSEHYTEILEADRHDSTRRELSVEVSIKISLAHLPAESDDTQPRRLLSVLGQLPAGLFPAVSAKLRLAIHNIDPASQDLLRHSLVYRGGWGELRLLSPVRHHVSRILPVSSTTQSTINHVYLEVAVAAPLDGRGNRTEWPGYDLEIPNIMSVFSTAVDHPSADLSQSVTFFATYCTAHGHSCLSLLHKLLPRIQHEPESAARCLLAIAFQYRAIWELGPAIEALEQAGEICAEVDHRLFETIARKGLVDLCASSSRDHDADRHRVRFEQLTQESSGLSHLAAVLPGEGAAAAEQRFKDSRLSCIQNGDTAGAIKWSEKIMHLVSERNDFEEYTAELEFVHAFGVQETSKSAILAVYKVRLALEYVAVNRLDGAESLLIEAHASLLEHNDPNAFANLTRVFGLLRLKQHLLDDAIELTQAASRLFREVGDRETAEQCDQNIDLWKMRAIDGGE